MDENDKDDGGGERHTTKSRLGFESETTAIEPDSLSLIPATEQEVSLLTENHDAPATTVEGKVPDLAFILHPSHESPGSRDKPVLTNSHLETFSKGLPWTKSVLFYD